jgi:hypothetical protein
MERNKVEIDPQSKPAAGCTSCGGHAWALILDKAPPEHTTITQFVCVVCGGGMDVHIPIDKIAPREEVVDV